MVRSPIIPSLGVRSFYRFTVLAAFLGAWPLTASAQGPLTKPRLTDSTKDEERKVLYSVPGTISQRKQPDDMACWATAATMMLEWRLRQQFGSGIKLEIEDTVKMADQSRKDQVPKERRFTYLFENGSGLSDADKPAFLKALGFTAEWPANYTVEGWKSLLRDYGPLWVTTEISEDGQAFVHAQIVTGLAGSGSYAGTSVIFVDPRDGKEHRENLIKFVHRYEAVIIDDTKADAKSLPRFQVLHFDRRP